MAELIEPKNPMVANDHLSQVAGHLIVPFGTTANNLIAVAGARVPAMLARAVGLDGEQNLPAEGERFTINNGSVEDWERVRAWRTLPVVKNDCLLPHVDIPPHMGAGAGRQRLLGHIRYHTKRVVFVTRVKDTVRAVLTSKQDEGAAQRTIFHVHFVSTLVGGMGAGCLPIGILDTLAAIHEEMPAMHVHATAHLLGASCFGGLTREKERKMQRSTDGLLCELIYLQDADNLRAFAERMEVFLPDARDRLLDEIVEYAGSNSRNVTFSLAESFARVEANIQAAFNPAWSWVHIEREGCNRNVRADLTSRRIVTNFQASISAIPALLPQWFANRWLFGTVAPLLATGDMSQLDGELDEAAAALDVEKVFHKRTRGAFEKIGRGIIEDAEAQAAGGEITVRLDKKLEVLSVNIGDHFPALAKKQVHGWVLALAEQHTSLGKLGTLIKQVLERLGEAKRRAEAAMQRVDNEAGDGPKPKRGFFRSHSGLLEFVSARLDAECHRSVGKVFGLYMQEMESWVDKLEALAESLRVIAIEARKEVAKSEETIRGDSSALVKAAEIAGMPASMQAFLSERGEAPPRVSLSSILQRSGTSWLVQQSQKVAESVRRQLAAESVTSFCASLKLSFDLAGWLRDRLENLGGTCSLVPALIPTNEEEQTVVVAQGADFAALERLLKKSPRLCHQLERVRGTQAGTVLVVRGYYHAPIDAMAARAPARRALVEYRRQHPSAGMGAKKVLDSIQASCGALLAAHDTDAPGPGPSAVAPASPLRPTPCANPGNGQAPLAAGHANS